MGEKTKGKIKNARDHEVTVPNQDIMIRCGIDRFSVRMSESVGEPEQVTVSSRCTKPYIRTPPPPKQKEVRYAASHREGIFSSHDQDRVRLE